MISILPTIKPPTPLTISPNLLTAIKERYANDDPKYSAAMRIARLCTDWNRTDAIMSVPGKMGELEAFKFTLPSELWGKRDIKYLMSHELVVELEISLYSHNIVLLLLYADNPTTAEEIRSATKHELFARRFETEKPKDTIFKIDDERWKKASKTMYKLTAIPKIMPIGHILYMDDPDDIDKTYNWGFVFTESADGSSLRGSCDSAILSKVLDSKESKPLPTDDIPIVSTFFGSVICKVMDRPHVEDVFFSISGVRKLFGITFYMPPVTCVSPTTKRRAENDAKDKRDSKK